MMSMSKCFLALLLLALPAHGQVMVSNASLSNVDVSGGAAAGGPVAIFTYDVEENDESDFDSKLNGTNIAVTAGSALSGTNYGIELTDDGTSGPDALRDDISGTWTGGDLCVRFYFDPNSFNDGAVFNAVDHVVFRYNAGGSVQYNTRVRYDGSGNYSFRAGIKNDSSSWVETGWQDFSDAPHKMEVYWTRASSAVASDGAVYFEIDDLITDSNTGIDIYDLAVADGIRVGANDAYWATEASGSVYIDEIEVFDEDCR